MRFDRHAEVPGGKSDKKHKCDAQRDAEDFYSPECKSDGDDERVHHVGEVRTDSMMAGAAQVLREGKPWTL